MGLPTAFVNQTATVTTTSTGTATTIFTHSSALKNPDGSAGNGGVLDRLLFHNPDTVSHTINLYRVPSGGSVGTSYIIDIGSIGIGGAPYVFEGPAYGSSGVFYAFALGEALGSTGKPCVATAFYHEMS